MADGKLNDYPKFGAWPDANYMSANIFHNGQSWDGVQVWAFNRADMLAGKAEVRSVFFSLGPQTGYASLLPSHMLSQPPAGAPNYFASVSPPDKFQIWEFHVDWGNPAGSTFTGPKVLEVADFAIAASVPQRDSDRLLDSLSYRPMMQLIYRQTGGVDSLWLTHTVASQGVGGMRWYEIRNPGVDLPQQPAVFQQGTYQPRAAGADPLHRWMGALAVDQDGNMALGYSVSSASMYPAIRYAGRLAGEIPGELPQAEVSLIEGSGSQRSYQRWGDYSSMSVDPVDDCTFWYTTEYYASNGTNWQTRIGTFKFPSCGQAKGAIQGTVRNSVTNAPIPGVKVIAQSSGHALSVLADGNGQYNMALPAGTFQLSAGPFPPGFPNPANVSGVTVSVSTTTHQDLLLVPIPNLAGGETSLSDPAPYGNANGFAEPGEQALQLTVGVQNTGATAATGVTARLYSLTPGVLIYQGLAAYPDVPVGQARTSATPFLFSVPETIACGADLDFRLVMSSAQGTYASTFSLNASVRQARQEIFHNNVEGGLAGWTTGGSGPAWAITGEDSHSPTHSWTDSPGGAHQNNIDTFIRSPVYNLAGKRYVEIGGWYKYDLEPGYDYAYLEYSLDGGALWEAGPLMVFNGVQSSWVQDTVDASVLDYRPNVALRFRLVTDPGVVEDGIYVDDVSMTYEPFECAYTPSQIPGPPAPVFPADNGFDYNPVTLAWSAGEYGAAPAGYRVTVDGSQTIQVSGNVTSTTISGLSLGMHTWQVTAFTGAGDSLPSETRTVEVLAVKPGAPGTPTLLSPSAGGQASHPAVTFRWEADRNGGTPAGYTLVLDGTAVVALSSRINQVTLRLEPGVHTWTVRADNAAGHSPYAQMWTFTVPHRLYTPFTFRD
jgi:hypothetical protein